MKGNDTRTLCCCVSNPIIVLSLKCVSVMFHSCAFLTCSAFCCVSPVVLFELFPLTKLVVLSSEVSILVADFLLIKSLISSPIDIWC